MLFEATFFAALLNGLFVHGMDVNSIIPRTNCYPNVQANCNEDFIAKYPHLSKSATNLTDAETYFLLFTRRNPDKPEKLHKCAGELPPDTNFNPKKDLIVIVMPFIVGICDIAVYREWIYEMLQRDDYNILVVDYTWGNRVDYGTAVLNIKIVGAQTVIVLKNIKKKTKITKDKIYLVGHSLGAQCAAIIGKHFPVRRITGIDPAGPAFDKNTPKDDRLDPSDADFVDVWHCNAGCLPNFGINYDAGHANFYINGGTVQKSSYEKSFVALLKNDYIYGLGTMFPTVGFHAQCAQYYRVSINPGKCQFVGVKCKSYFDFESGKCSRCGRNGKNCLIMGFDTDKFVKEKIKCPQRYYVDTSLTCPYCDNSKIKLDGYCKIYSSSLQKE